MTCFAVVLWTPRPALPLPPSPSCEEKRIDVPPSPLPGMARFAMMLRTLPPALPSFLLPPILPSPPDYEEKRIEVPPTSLPGMTCLAVVLWTPRPALPLPPIPLPPPPGYQEKRVEMSPSPPPAYEKLHSIYVWRPSRLEALPCAILQKVLNYCESGTVTKLMRTSPTMHSKICNEIARSSFNFFPKQYDLPLVELIRVPYIMDYPVDMGDFKAIIRLFLLGRVAISKHKYHLGELCPGEEYSAAMLMEIDRFLVRRAGEMIQRPPLAMWKISSDTQHMNITFYGNRIRLNVTDHRRFSFTRRRPRTNAYYTR